MTQASSTQNPLTSDSQLPHGAVPFNQIKDEHFLPALKQRISEAKKRIEALRSNAEPESFENTIEALEESTELVDWTAGVFFGLLSAHTNDKLQSLAQDIGPLLAEFSSDILLDEKIFERVKGVFAQRKNLSLSREQDRLLEKTYLNFVRNGAELNERDKARLREIDERLSQLGPKFNEHVLKATNAFEMWLKTPEEISGLPESALEAARAAAESKGRLGEYLFTLQAPSLMPFLKFADHRPSREKLLKASSRRAFKDEFDNQSIIIEMIDLRRQRAQCLGYKTHADFVLEERMAESPDKVRRFLDRLLKVAKPAAEKELEELADFARAMGGPDKLEAWDFSYYSEKLKEKKFSFNEEALRPYFQLESVVDGVFSLASRLYLLRFQSSDQFSTYHPEVKTLEVYQSRPGQKEEFIGLLYLDFFPRESKRDGAWAGTFLEQGRFKGSLTRPHASIVCNFTKPTQTKPSLLTFTEVTTLFHEFGHALHMLLSQCTYRSLAGANVYWDFVELPSQIMENWAKEEQGLELFAKHYQTGETLPTELAEKIKASDRFMAGYNCLRQLNFAYLDLAWHTLEQKADFSVEDLEIQATEKTRLLPRVEGANASCSFGHIFAGGYSAGYYSYKWAEVLDADAFELFKETGVFNQETARRFEETILSKGGTEHPMELYKKFRGREPDPDALLRRDGLL